jgi:hypothetical protein
MSLSNFFFNVFYNFKSNYLFFFLKNFFFFKTKFLSKKKKDELFFYSNDYLASMSLYFRLEKVLSTFSFFYFIDSFFIFLLFSAETSKTFFKNNTRIQFRMLQSDTGLYLNLLNSNKTVSSSTFFFYGLKSL